MKTKVRENIKKGLFDFIERALEKEDTRIELINKLTIGRKMESRGKIMILETGTQEAIPLITNIDFIKDNRNLPWVPVGNYEDSHGCRGE